MTTIFKANILYVEDDMTLSFVTRDSLERVGYRVVHCEDGEDGLIAYQNSLFDICIFDVMLPKLDGFSLARKIRETDTHIPILFLTAKSMKEDKIEGLSLGGDDYITKPYSIEELILKIEVFLRRSRIIDERKNQKELIRIGQYQLDTNNLVLKHAKTESSLTYKEAELLKYLSDKQGELLKREDILIAVWGDDSYYLSRSLDVFISRLRKLLAEDERIKIKNVHGIGFKFQIE
jgi:DNA-binding response OmpR family regulator